MLCQPLKSYHGLVRRKQSFLAHSHQDAYRRRKNNANQLARIDPILVIDAQNTSFVRESQDDTFRFTPAEAKVSPKISDYGNERFTPLPSVLHT
jgi:hypothetical protein